MHPNPPLRTGNGCDRRTVQPHPMSAEVLTIDPVLERARAIARYLRDHGLVCHHAADGRAGLRQVRDGGLDAVLLEAALPDLDAFQALRLIRERASVPVVVLTEGGDQERARSLELGADDALSRPFSGRELLARLRAIFRRSQPQAAQARLQLGVVRLDLKTRTATLTGSPLALTQLEFDLLTALVRRRGRVVPRASLLSLAGRANTTVNERSIDVHISRLRRKLGARPEGKLIQTVRGVGYVLSGECA